MKVFTTGQVAKICKVAPRTVSKWFDSGRLKGYRIPGSQDRRIPREYLIRFLKEHGMPLGDLEDEAMAKVLIVGQDQVLIENLKRELPAERSFRVAVAASGFEAGIQAESFHPDSIIVDFSIGRTEALQICQNLRRNAEYADTILIALLPDDGNANSFDRSSINETFKKPFDVALLGRTRPHADWRPQGTRLKRIRRRPTGPLLRRYKRSTRRGRPPRRFGNIRGSRTTRLMATLGIPGPSIAPLSCGDRLRRCAGGGPQSLLCYVPTTPSYGRATRPRAPAARVRHSRRTAGHA